MKSSDGYLQGCGMYCEMVSYIGAVLEFVAKIFFYDAFVAAIDTSF